MNIIVIDIETTGLDTLKDEILQVSIIDGKGETLLNEYCKPDNITEWKEAERIHGITSDMVRNKKSFTEYVEEINSIISTVDRIVVYNGLGFDIPILIRYGVEIERGSSKVYDLMIETAEILRLDTFYKLTALAEHYGYEFKAHDSLEDCKATLYCYYKFLKEKSNMFFQRKRISFILQNMNDNTLKKAEMLVKEHQVLKLDYDMYGNYVGVRNKLKNYNINLLFDKGNRMIDSQCSCLDCLDGGNRLCKHVVATLIGMFNNDIEPYDEVKQVSNMLLKQLKENK